MPEIIRRVIVVMLLVMSASSAAWPNEAPPETAKEESEIPAAPGFLPVPALNISVIKENRVRGVLVVNLVLDIAGQQAMEAANGQMPRLADGYAAALAKWSNSFQSVREPANVIAIKNQLQQVTNHILGRDDVHVLLQSALLTPQG